MADQMTVEQALSVLGQVTGQVALVRADHMAVLKSFAVIRGEFDTAKAELAEKTAELDGLKGDKGHERRADRAEGLLDSLGYEVCLGTESGFRLKESTDESGPEKVTG